MSSKSRSQRIRLMESFSNPELREVAKRLFGYPVPKRFSKDELTHMIHQRGGTSVNRLGNMRVSNNMANRALQRKFQERNALIRNLRKKTNNYQPLREPRGYDITELLLNSMRARNETISKLQSKLRILNAEKYNIK